MDATNDTKPATTSGKTKSGNHGAVNLAELLNERDGRHLPVWVRCPVRGPEHFSGFRRGSLYALANQGTIRSVAIRAPGKIRGTRLFHLGSILDFIARCEANAHGTSATNNTPTTDSN